ncbi:SDR family NAD(P)-dependent oxidoreductase [Asanoa iriomotensis]|uniref:Beta-ketoacyl-ACP reductase n=1 Tax=Asanoa iriomotensis TaxID=234613 RepID=A0ABQ4BZ51_9ACTN|nr:SDR family NAD(P)-dependent oxidoreductase [Asanoa iriomotensis]GIF55816.1 beta-ketoacyl-ACP reductase [Asanoa iriomotensis]
MSETLAGSAVIVTGATGGIGAAVARMVAAEGVAVVAVDLAVDRLDRLLADLPGAGHRSVAVDLRDLATHDRILDAAGDTGRPLAGLAHLAAVLRRRHRLEDITEEDWDLQVDTNLKATFFLNRAVGLRLAAAGNGGAIVNLSSQGWWTGGLGGSVVYNAAKGGIVSMSRGLARTLAPQRVRVNTVAPGFVDTEMMRAGMTDEQLAASVAMVPLGRMATPDEIADAVVYLLRPGARYVTGATLNVSGGQLMY